MLDALQEMLVDIAGHYTTDERLGLRVIWPYEWENWVSLATDEIRQFGTSSIQIDRRLRSLFADLREALPAGLHPPLDDRVRALDEARGSSWPLAIDRELSSRADPMGLGSTGR